MYYYFTRWTCLVTPEGLENNVGPFQAIWVGHIPPAEFLERIKVENLKEFFYKQFKDEKEMEAYADSVGITTYEQLN